MTPDFGGREVSCIRGVDKIVERQEGSVVYRTVTNPTVTFVTVIILTSCNDLTNVTEVKVQPFPSTNVS